MNQAQPNNGTYLPWVLEQIRAISETIKSNVIEYSLDEFSKLNDAPPVSVQRAIIFQLAEEKAIEILDTYSDTSDLSKLKPARDGGFLIEPYGFSIKILRPKFEKIIKSLVETIPSSDLSFNTEKSILYFFGIPVEIPAYKNEYYFCKIVFSHKKGELVSWDEIYEEMTGGEPFGKEEKFRKSVMDTMILINKRIKEKTKSEKILFSRKNNMIRRNF